MPVIRIVAYDPNWPLLYEQIRTPLAEAFGTHARDIQHVGSTSVPGLAAKPIIDISVAIDHYPLPDEIVQAVVELGYEHRGEYGIPRRHYFRRPGPPHAIHIHATEHDSEQYNNHILFRDYLRAHPEAAVQYQHLKRDLASRFANDGEVYTDSKTDFVMQTLEKARAWREGSQE